MLPVSIFAVRKKENSFYKMQDSSNMAPASETNPTFYSLIPGLSVFRKNSVFHYMVAAN
jgi:hypothetical protein